MIQPRVVVGLLALALLPGRGVSQTSTPVPSDTANALPIEPVRTLSFSTDEGTWISLDVAPDGQAIVFDLLGDLYTIPITGGQATRVTSGTPWDGMPRWSPDGSSIAFISDRDGGDNLWVVSPDGTGLRKLTGEVDNTLSSPAWSPDGSYLVVRRFGPYPTAENYLTNVPLWMYHVDGGSGTQVYPADASSKTTNTGSRLRSRRKDPLLLQPRRRVHGRKPGVVPGGGVRSRRRDGATPDGWVGGRSPAGRVALTAAGLSMRPGPAPELLSGSATCRVMKTTGSSPTFSATTRKDTRPTTSSRDTPSHPTLARSSSTGAGRSSESTSETREVQVIPFSVDVEIGMAERHFLPLQVDDGLLDITQLPLGHRKP